MKRKLLAVMAVIGIQINSYAAVSIALDAGILRKPDFTVAPFGSLLVLAATTLDTSFNMPTPTSFVSGDDVVLAMLSTNDVNAPGSHSELVTISFSGNLGQGDQMAIFWFPTLTTMDTAPGFNTPYGFYQFSDPSEFLPGDGGYISVAFQTMSFYGGPLPDIAGVANLTTIPEPTTYGLIGMGLLGLVYLARRKGRVGV